MIFFLTGSIDFAIFDLPLAAFLYPAIDLGMVK